MNTLLTSLVLCGLMLFGHGLLDPVAGQQPMAPPEVSAVLTQIRTAVGYDALQNLSGVVLEGTARDNGMDGTYHLTFSPTGHFVRRTQTRWAEVAGFDGTTGWGLDHSGAPRVLELEDQELPQSIVWITTGRWLAADSPFTVRVL